ncbi:MAG: protein-arginine deiminase family protein [Nannocystales bacterium]
MIGVLVLAAPACGDDAGGGGDEGGGTTGSPSESEASTGGSGTEDPSTSSASGSETGADTEGDTEGAAFDPEAYVLDDVFGTPNLDDDDGNDRTDWLETVFEADDDVSALEVPGAPEGYTVELIAGGELDDFRLWDGDAFAIGVADEVTAQTYSLEPGPDGATLDVEFGAFNTQGSLEVRLLDPDGTEVSNQEIRVMGSPLIMNHHLQPSEGVWVMDVDANFGSNAAMVDVFATVLGDQFDPVDDATYGFDVWVQDEIEFATATGQGGQRLDIVIDSVRDRGLDDFPEDEFVGPSFIAARWGDPALATTWDSFGNLEASPPVTVDGVEYPFGKIYYGREAGNGLQSQLGDFLASQTVQAPFEVDTLWLCVGHVDEFSSFVPDPSSDKGFKFLISDVDAAWDVIDALPPSTPLGRFGPDHGFATAGELQNDAGLRALNDELQADELDPIREQFIAELGLDESDIIYVPSLFEEIPGCGVAALIPGMVNLIVSNPEDGPIDLFLADPFFRQDEGDQSSDPMIEAFSAALPDGMVPHYVDNWDVYHLALGEVHCGTNVLRAPTEDWWTTALPLLENDR